MYYYLIRLIVVLILLYIVLLLIKKGKLVIKRTRKAAVIRVMVSALIIAVVMIPYESPFIRFDSAEASVNYSSLNYNYQIKTIETEKTAFCVAHKGNDFQYDTITKYINQYGFCDRHSKNILRWVSSSIEDGKVQGSFRAAKLINNETNEKCYMIVFSVLAQEETADINIYDKQNKPIPKIEFSDNREVFALVVNHLDGEEVFKFNGVTYDLH